MYLMTYTTAFINAYGRYCPVTLDNRDRIGILDTDDLVEENFTKEEFESLLKSYPDVKVKGIKHDKKTITHLYGFGNNNHFLTEEGICFHYEQKTDKGSFCTIRVYLQGTTCENGCDLQIDTPHVEGCYDWDFNIRGSKQTEVGYDVEISCKIRSKRYDHEFKPLILSVNTVNNSCDFKQFIDPKEASMY